MDVEIDIFYLMQVQSQAEAVPLDWELDNSPERRLVRASRKEGERSANYRPLNEDCID